MISGCSMELTGEDEAESLVLLRREAGACRLCFRMCCWAPGDWAVLRRWERPECCWRLCLPCGCLGCLPPGTYVLDLGQCQRQLHLLLELPPGRCLEVEACPLRGTFRWRDRTGDTAAWRTAPPRTGRPLTWGAPPACTGCFPNYAAPRR